MFRFAIFVFLCNAVASAHSQDAPPVDTSAVHYKWVNDVFYRQGQTGLDNYAKERCKFDLYHPVGIEEFSTVVWFHGGGLKNGEKFVPKELINQGIAVIAVNYRKHPKVKSPVYVRDAAAAVAWAIKNIKSYGGSPKKVFVSGHSAGGYLASMVGLDESYLRDFGVSAHSIAGLIPFSGHTITHFTIRAERGIDGKQVIVDEMAPLYHVRKDGPPMLLITGDRDLEILGRYEENAYFWRMMQEVGHPSCELHELEGFDHSEMSRPAMPLLLKFVRKHSQL